MKNINKNSFSLIVSLVSFLFLATGVSDADWIFEYEIDAVISGYQNTSGAVGLQYAAAGNHEGPWWGDDLGVGRGNHAKQSWVKYEIPEYAAEQIVEIRLQLNDIKGYTAQFGCGWDAWFSSDNDWLIDDIASDHDYDADSRERLSYPSDSRSYPYNASSDITGWFENPNALQGEYLTVKFTAGGGGGTRAEGISSSDGTLIIRTIPEPGMLALLGLGGLIVLSRRRL